MNVHWMRLVPVVVSLTLLSAVAAAAPAPTKLTIAASPGLGGRVNVEARLTGADGKPLGLQTISLSLETSFFGERPVSLGKEVTDSAGVATFQYMPNWSGAQQLQARVAGSEALAPSEAKTTYAVSAATTVPWPHESSMSPLAPIWRLTGGTAAIVIVSIWIILIGTLVWVRIGIKRLSIRP